MNNTPVADACALRATASAFDAQRNTLPVPGDRSPDTVAVARQISQLGTLITTLGDQVLFRANSENQAPHSASVITSFAAVVAPAGEAASALGAAVHLYSFLDQTEHLRDQPDARDAREGATRVAEGVLRKAHTALREVADSLHAASATISPPSARVQAARSRSTTAAPAPTAPPATTPASAAAADRITRGR
ncbi:hypothetical protein GCM10012285_41290 [Streptomyces kronopolitis]|uniref:Uncharacterized protein n=1 Tax=Streptomyces kronopolitis TaxID=1612435 RepID=A0ABQ2JQ63_9ACTN|nr:hypothetical protein [Streptomyces kronopolitis]GGN51305.1 hypothetical protein GCM10012285_41290 [Streptomyces kronopolitis]